MNITKSCGQEIASRKARDDNYYRLPPRLIYCAICRSGVDHLRFAFKTELRQEMLRGLSKNIAVYGVVYNQGGQKCLNILKIPWRRRRVDHPQILLNTARCEMEVIYIWVRLH